MATPIRPTREIWEAGSCPSRRDYGYWKKRSPGSAPAIAPLIEAGPGETVLAARSDGNVSMPGRGAGCSAPRSGRLHARHHFPRANPRQRRNDLDPVAPETGIAGHNERVPTQY